MKKILLLASYLFGIGAANAQVSAYSFSQSSGTYTPITGGTVVATATGATGGASLDDINYTAIPIPFTFTFDGTGYTSLTINTNGHVVFGTAGLTNNYAPISSTGTYSGCIAAAGRDLNSLFSILGNTGEIRYETVGTAPNQEFVIQYSNFRPYSTSTSTTTFWRWNFQIRLHETTNVIDIVYDYNFVGTPAASTTTNEIGLRGPNNTFPTNVNNRLIINGTHTWATSAAGIANNSKCNYNTTLLPVSGQTFTWTPPLICTGSPNAGTTVAPAAACSGVNFNLSLSGSTTGVTGLTYQWLSSSNGVTFTPIAGATTMNYSVSQTDTTWYACVVTCTGSAQDDTSNIVQVNINNFYNCYCAISYTNSADTKIDSVFIDGISTGSAPTTCETYTDYTAVAGIDLQIASSNALRVRNGSCSGNHYGAYVSVYIDYNHDGDYLDAGEQAATYGQTTALNSIPVLNINPPLTALSGLTGMRIVFDEGTVAPASCGVFDYGEAEDYIVNLLPAIPCVTPPVAGTISGASIDTISNTGQYIVTGFTGTIQWYYTTNSSGTWNIITGETNDTLNYTFTTLDTLHFYIIASNPGCYNDTSAALTTVVIMYGDSTCEFIDLNLGINGPYNNAFATQQIGEPMPPLNGCEHQNSWCNDSSTPNNSMWFAFSAPASGRIIAHTPEFDTRIAIWSAASCTDLTTGGATLIAANDDDPNYIAHGGAMFSSYIDSVYCLIPGNVYYLQVDGYGTSTGTFTITLTDPGFPDTTFSGLPSSICYVGGEIDSLTAVTPGGVFTGSGLTGNVFYADSVAFGNYTITYTLFTCYSSSQTIAVSDFPTVDLGPDTIACISYIIDAGNTGSTYLWNDASTAQTLNATTTGTYYVEVTNAAGCTNTDTVIVTIDPCLGLHENNISNIQIYPNPASTQITVVTSAQGIFTIYDSNGKKALSKTINGNNVIRLEELSNGIYTIIFATENGQTTSRLVINK